LGKLKEDLRRARVISLDPSYRYIVNPLSSGTPEIHPEVLWGCAFEMARAVDVKRANKIVTPEAMGIHLAAAMSMVTDLPFVVARKVSYGLPGEIEVVKKTAYAESRLYVNYVQPGDRVIVVDSIIATGGTISALVRALEERGVEVVDVVTVIEREGLGGAERVRRETGKEVKTLVRVTLRGDEVEVL